MIFGKKINTDSSKAEEVLLPHDSGFAEYREPNELTFHDTKKIKNYLLLVTAAGEMMKSITVSEFGNHGKQHKNLFHNVTQVDHSPSTMMISRRIYHLHVVKL